MSLVQSVHQPHYQWPHTAQLGKRLQLKACVLLFISDFAALQLDNIGMPSNQQAKIAAVAGKVLQARIDSGSPFLVARHI